MHETGEFLNSDSLQVECVRYCMTHFLQNDQDDVRRLWNTHRIRNNRSAACPSGIPDLIYHSPDQYNASDFKQVVSLEDLELANDIGADEPEDCLEEFKQLADINMAENEWQTPDTREQAATLYRNVISELNTLVR